MIKTYKSSGSGTATPGNNGVAGWMRIFSPQRKLRLLSIDWMFYSVNPVTHEWDNPQTDRFNYAAVMLDNTGLETPFFLANNSFAAGTAIVDNYTRYMIFPGHYECDYQYNEEIWIAMFTYNYTAVDHYHSIEVFATVDEQPK